MAYHNGSLIAATATAAAAAAAAAAIAAATTLIPATATPATLIPAISTTALVRPLIWLLLHDECQPTAHPNENARQLRFFFLTAIRPRSR